MFITNDTEYRAARDQIVEYAMRDRSTINEAELENMEQLLVELELYVQSTYKAPTVLDTIAQLPSENERDEALETWARSVISPKRLN